MSTTRLTEHTEIAAFYDDDLQRCLRDYVDGNIRMTSAIQLVVSQITDRVRNVLDVGCGIGISSAAFCQQRPWVRVHGVDISGQRIETARKLFPDQRLTFSVSAMDATVAEERYDLIALLDVYEHVPESKWQNFNEVLAASLADEGVVVLTLPSPLHQTHLAARRPDALQVVDETVRIEDVAALAQACRGTVTRFEFISIWKSNDYVHAVIDRNPRYERLAEPSTFTAKLARKAHLWMSQLRHSAQRRKRHQHVRGASGLDFDI